MQPRCLGRVKHGHGTGARRDLLAVGKADPLASVSVEELVTGSPVGRLVLAPVRVDLPGDLGGQLVGNAFHRTPRVNSDGPHLHSTSDRAVRCDHVNSANDRLPERDRPWRREPATAPSTARNGAGIADLPGRRQRPHRAVEQMRTGYPCFKTPARSRRSRGQTVVLGVRPSSAAHNAVGLAGESPVVGIDCLPT